MHFIGSIVYVCNDEYTTEEIEKYVIIDGQQRLTTVTLLLLALYNFARENEDTQFAEKIWEYYIINKNAENDEYKIKLKATSNNSRDLSRLLRNETCVGDVKFSNIINNYLFFRERINSENKNIIYEGFRRLLFVEIRLERGKDNAQKIFESLNSTGLDLSQADLIRNYVLMGLEPSIQTRYYQNYWSAIEENTKVNSVSFLSDFIRDYLTMEQGEISNKNAVYTSFKKKFPIEIIDIEPVLKELLQYSSFYKFLINPDIVEDKEIKTELKYIRHIEINVSYPFLLKVFNDYNTNVVDKQTFINILRFLQTYACRRFILDLPTNALNKIFMTLYRQINTADYEQSLYKHVLTRTGKVRMPSDAEIQKTLLDKDLYNSKSKMRSYILDRLENFENNEIVPIIENADITIEHIFPQNPDPKWKEQMSDTEYDTFLNLHLHTIGNLTLSGNNGKLGNKTFLEKKEMNIDNKEQGYKFSRLWLNRFLSEIEVWNEENYQKRSELLALKFLKVWKLPKIIGTEETQELNIFEIDDPTNKPIEYATFFDRQLLWSEYKGIKFYNYVIGELYQLQPEEFVTNFYDVLRLKENPNDLIRCQKLNSTYYFENNLSYLQMFNNLKKILSKMGFTDELYIKFKDSF